MLWFPGRQTLTWLWPCRSRSRYIVAYIYVDILGATARAGGDALDVRMEDRCRVLVPEGAFALRCDISHGPGPVYVYLAPGDVQTQAAQIAEAARVLGARPSRSPSDITAARAAGDRGRRRAGAARNAQRYRAQRYLGVQTLTLSIFTTWLNRGSLPGAAQIAWALLVFVAALIALERYGRRGRTFTAMTQQGARFSSRIVLKGPSRFLPAILCFVPVVLGFLLPGGYLVAEVDRAWPLPASTGLIRPALTTIALAAAATALVLALAFSAIAAARYLRHAFIEPASPSPASAMRSPAPCWRSAC